MKNLKLGLLTFTLMFAFSLSAQKKISQLPELVVPDSTDVLPIVNDGVTKKITVANLLNAASSGEAQTLSISNDSLSISGGNTIVLPASGGGSSLWQIENEIYVPTIDNQRFVIEYYDTKLILDSIMIEGELLLFSGNVITQIEATDTLILYDGVVYRSDFESMTYQAVIYNSVTLYSETLKISEGQKVIYTPSKTFAIDGELEVSNGGVNFQDSNFFKVPRWTILGRSIYPEIGSVAYNTDLNQMEYYNGTTWVQF